MIIRPAEPRDLSSIEGLFHKLVNYLRDRGQWLYAKDRIKLENGVSGYIVGVFHNDDHLMLVKEDDRGRVDGFLIGRLISFYPFFEHNLVAEVMAMYPLGVHNRAMARRFEEWAIERGATATCNYHTPQNDMAAKLFRHEGRRVAWEIWFRPFDEADYENLQQDRLRHDLGGSS